MLHHVEVTVPDVSKDHSVFVFRVKLSEKNSFFLDFLVAELKVL